MFTFNSQEIKKFRTQVWTALNFPTIYSDQRFEQGVVTRIQGGLEINVKGYEIVIPRDSLEMGVIKLEGLERVPVSVQPIVWDIVEQIKQQISETQLIFEGI
jgi:hypothetical protein